MGTIIKIIFLIIAFFVLKSYVTKKVRRKRIYQKYGYTEIADRIIKKIIWVGETSDQLLDSLDQPLDIDENVLKTKTKEIWKYYQKGINRYGLKITVENGVVVGWDEKL